MLPRPASTSLFQHTGRVGMASPLSEVSGKHVGTDEGIVVRAGVTTPKSGRLSTSYGLVDACIVRQTGTLSAEFSMLIAT
eukprot:scaffold22612_cov86-Cyclotella_meneghiniana.AAC.1